MAAQTFTEQRTLNIEDKDAMRMQSKMLNQFPSL